MLDTRQEVYEYAVAEHESRKHTYDVHNYNLHIDGVLAVCKRYMAKYFTEEEQERVYKGCCCHDLLEDCNINYAELKRTVGQDVADDVYDVTNELGKTRAERNKRTYEKIANNKYALFIKLCDRIANTRFSFYMFEKGGMFEKYWKEFPEFRDTLRNGLYLEMWAELDDLNHDINK
jgi:(p)ppGpp synthase/HD superfamily hydrolase